MIPQHHEDVLLATYRGEIYYMQASPNENGDGNSQQRAQGAAPTGKCTAAATAAAAVASDKSAHIDTTDDADASASQPIAGQEQRIDGAGGAAAAADEPAGMPASRTKASVRSAKPSKPAAKATAEKAKPKASASSRSGGKAGASTSKADAASTPADSDAEDAAGSDDAAEADEVLDCCTVP